MIIFLDIDGVMVPAKSWKSPELLQDGFYAFSDKATYALQKLVSESTTIILTTSHKDNFSVEEWTNIFKRRNIYINNLICLPPNVRNISRKEEIVNWFNVNNIEESFIIIDDDKSLNELPPYLKDRLIQTYSHIGLTNEHVELINAKSLEQLSIA